MTTKNDYAKLFTDGGSRGNPGSAATGAFLFDTDDRLLGFTGQFIGTATNNIAEYEALLHGLQLAKKQKITDLDCYLDSELIVKQLNGAYRVKNEAMKKLFARVQKKKETFKSCTFTHVPRAQNKHADALVNVILDNTNVA